MFENTNISVVKNTLVNIIRSKPDEAHIKEDYNKYTSRKIIGVIEDAVIRTNNIVFHTYNFIKLYILYHRKHGLVFPTIDKDFVYMVMVVVSVRGEIHGRKPSSDKQKSVNVLIDFFYEHYEPLIEDFDIVYDDKLSYILKYECIDIVKNINNNISMHFINHLRKYINILFEVKEKRELIKKDKSLSDCEKKLAIRKINERYNNIKYDILSLEKDFKCEEEFIGKVKEMRKQLLPLKYIKNNVFYDLKANPQIFLKQMIKMNEEIQRLGEERKCEYKLFHILPLRTTIVPRYITLDTAAIVSLFIGTAGYYKKLSELSDVIWGTIFHLRDKSFKRKDHKFINMIKTDGVGCSILLEKMTKEEIETGTVTKIKKVDGRSFKVHNKETKDESKYEHRYIENVKLNDRAKKKNFVFIDPGHNDLINCMGTNYANPKEEIFFRYTRKQRNAESKKNRNKKIMKKIKSAEIIGKETLMAKHNSKTCDPKKFEIYLKAKITLNRELTEHYVQKIYRKLKFNMYTNTQKSESHMLNNFTAKMGKPEETIVVFGDYSKKETMKGSEPHITKRIKRLMVNRGYKIYLINEYNTSKLCNKCSSVTKNVKEEKDGEVKKIWKLIRCTSGECSMCHNRDKNAVRNMKKIMWSLIEGKGRPIKYIPFAA